MSALVNAASSPSSRACTPVTASHAQLGSGELSLVGERAWACSSPHWENNFSKPHPQPALGGSMAPTAGGGGWWDHTAPSPHLVPAGPPGDLSEDTTDSRAGPGSAFLKGALRAALQCCLTACLRAVPPPCTELSATPMRSCRVESGRGPGKVWRHRHSSS